MTQRTRTDLRWTCAGLFFLARTALPACECPSTTPEELKEQATYVLVGTVYDVSSPKGSAVKNVTFDVDDVFKGEPHAQIKVIDGEAGTECALDFKENDSYRVYPRWEWGTLIVSSCTGTSPIPQTGHLRGLGPSEEIKEKIYKALWESCLGKRTTGCCLSSVSAMRKGHYLPELEEGCPEGTIPDRLKCAGSQRWCIGMTGEDPEHRRSSPAK